MAKSGILENATIPNFFSPFCGEHSDVITIFHGGGDLSTGLYNRGGGKPTINNNRVVLNLSRAAKTFVGVLKKKFKMNSTRDLSATPVVLP